jgi:hypothetical protein
MVFTEFCEASIKDLDERNYLFLAFEVFVQLVEYIKSLVLSVSEESHALDTEILR